jgi:integrase
MTMTAVAKRSLSTACNSCVSNIGRGANKVSLEKFPPTARNRLWWQIEFGRNAALHVRRAKDGRDAVHPIRGDKLRALTAPNDGIDTLAIQDWLGHVSIVHTTRYTQLSPARFKDFWRD